MGRSVELGVGRERRALVHRTFDEALTLEVDTPLPDRVWHRTGRELGKLGRRQLPHAFRVRLSDLDRLAIHAVAEQLLVLRVESLDDVVEAVSCNRAEANTNVLLVVLTQVPHTDASGDLWLSRVSLALEVLGRKLDELVELSVEQVQVDHVRAVIDRLSLVDSRVGQQRSEGRADAWMQRYENPLHRLASRDVGCVDWASTAEGNEIERAVIETTLPPVTSRIAPAMFSLTVEMTAYAASSRDSPS